MAFLSPSAPRSERYTRSRDDYNPPHTRTAYIPIFTPPDVRIGLTLMPARYIGRGFFKSLADMFFSTKLDKEQNKIRFNQNYDVALGVGSGIMSYKMNRRVKQDMMHLYSETVSYETGKPLDAVTWEDIKESPNRIIQSTNHNFQKKRTQRYATDALFFLRLPFKSLSASDLAIGAKGVMWFSDVWGRKPTMLESFIYFVNDKLNPEYGISDPISKGDIINFYQQYTSKFAPAKAFHTLIASNPTDARIWAQSEPLFARMTELMNLSYNYKHVTQIDEETGHPIASAQFTLPKFIYLLGHDLLDPTDPVKTLAYVEVANSYGMEAVKDMEQQFAKGVNLRKLLEQYPVSLDALRNDLSQRAPEEAEKSSPIGAGALNATDQAQAAKPASKIYTAHTQAAPLAEAAEKAVLPV